MFQSFTGTSRKPRNVNLSGRNTNPFAAGPASQHSTVPQNSQNAIAHAQQERRARQQERDRLQAAKTLQKTWRGHASRKEIKSRYRQEWDYREGVTTGNFRSGNRKYGSEQEALAQLKLLIHFASPHEPYDTLRIHRFVLKVLALSSAHSFSIDNLEAHEEWRLPLLRAAKTVAQILSRNGRSPPLPADTMETLLLFLGKASRGTANEMALSSTFYYSALRSLIATSPSPRALPIGCTRTLIQEAVISLLKPTFTNSMAAYEGFTSEFLTIPELSGYLPLEDIAGNLDAELLTKSLKRTLSPEAGSKLLNSRSKEQLLWLLAHYIKIRRLGTTTTRISSIPDSDHITVISSLLSHLAEEIRNRMNGSANPLPAFVESEISSLLSQESITSLLAHSDFGIASQRSISEASGEAAVLASYALTLLRIFPRRGDEIRMWLYLGSTARQSSNNKLDTRVPAIKYFWDAVVRTEIFKTISEAPSFAIDLLKAEREAPDHSKHVKPSIDREREWRVLLLFLELYTFVLKVMDDEEFMTGANDMQVQQSWTRQSALRLGQVKELTIFLKNLAFAMYWNASDILGTKQQQSATSLAEYFNTSGGKLPVVTMPEPASKRDDFKIAGISGMTLDYMRGTVTGLLRMIYERE